MAFTVTTHLPPCSVITSNSKAGSSLPVVLRMHRRIMLFPLLTKEKKNIVLRFVKMFLKSLSNFYKA